MTFFLLLLFLLLLLLLLLFLLLQLLLLLFPILPRIKLTKYITCLTILGGYEFKKAIVDAIVELMGAISETKESSLLHLCEFIEDCEFSELIIQTLYIIGYVLFRFIH